jgi:hypothetical protein
MSDLDRIKEPFARLVRWVMRDAVYQRMYPARVVGQDAAGRLDLVPDDERIRGTGTQAVSIRHGLPGVSVEVPVGARVMLGFEEANPAKPYAALWEGVTPFTLINVGDFHVETGGTSRAGTGAQFVALANLVLNELNAIKAAYDVHTHAGVTAGPAVTAVPVPLLTPPGSVASSNLKAD